MESERQPRERADSGDDPECETTRYLGEDMARWSRAYLERMYLAWDLVLPDIGVEYRAREGIAPVLAWPWIVPFGPAAAREVTRYHCAPDAIRELKPHRWVPEFGITLAEDTAWWLRLGYSFVWHPRRSKLGLGLGIGPRLVLGTGPAKMSLSPELGLRYGACCGPVYATLVARYEHTLVGGSGQGVLVKLGLAYW